MVRVADGEHPKKVAEEAPAAPRTGAAVETAAGKPALPAGRPVRRGQSSRSRSYAQPQSSSSMREQIAWEYDNVTLRSDTHERNSRRWSTTTSCITVLVSLTSGISALSIFSHNEVAATWFATITALVAAVNAGFNPPEVAKQNLEAARAYGHLRRPLGELLFQLESKVRADELKTIWVQFCRIRERIEVIDDSAPSLRLPHTRD